MVSPPNHAERLSQRAAQDGPIVRNVQLTIAGPESVRLGQPIKIDIVLRSVAPEGSRVEYGSLHRVQFRVMDSSSHLVRQLHPLGVTILPHSYLVEDRTTVDLRDYAEIKQAGTYRMTAELTANFYGHRGEFLQRTSIPSNTIVVRVTPPVQMNPPAPPGTPPLATIGGPDDPISHTSVTVAPCSTGFVFHLRRSRGLFA